MNAKIIIIGGGIVGVSTLYHLTKAGEKDVLLLERRDLTAGATWHSAGNVHTQSAHANLSYLQAYSLRLYHGLADEVDQQVDSHVVGGLFLAQTSERMEEFKYLAGKFRRLGLEYELVTPAEIKARHPLLNVSDLKGGAWDPEEGYVDPYSVTMGLAAGARKYGGRIRCNTPVESINRLPSGNWHLASGDEFFECETIVNCAGFWAREVTELVGATVPVTNMEHQYLITDTMPAIAEMNFELPMVRDADSQFYLRQEGKGLLLGPWEKDCREAWNGQSAPWSFGQELFNEDLDRLQDSLTDIFERVPDLDSAGIKRIVNGAISFSPDGLPMIGPMPEIPGFFVACGFLGGIAQAGGIGLVMSQWILEGVTEYDVSFIDVARFGDWTTREFARERTYEILPIRYEIIYPGIERKSGRPLRTTPIYKELIARGAVMGQTLGWERPLWFAKNGVEPKDEPSFQRPNWWQQVGNEAKAIMTSCGMTEMSTYGKFLVTGPGAQEFLNKIGSARVPEQPGKMALSLLLNERGGIISDIVIDNLGESNFYLVGPTLGMNICERWLNQQANNFDVHIQNVTDQIAAIGVAGPNSRELLNALSKESFKNFQFMSAKQVEIDHVECRALRVSYSGELGWELHCDLLKQKELFDTLMKTGDEYGLSLVGSRAMGMLRLEKGFRSWGAEITTETTPHAAGLQQFCSTKKEFIGRAIVDSERLNSPKNRFVTLEVDPLAPPCWGTEPIMKSRELIGYVTSGGMGWRCGKMLAVAWIDSTSVECGDMLQVQILTRVYDATVVADPVYDPDNSRLLG